MKKFKSLLFLLCLLFSQLSVSAQLISEQQLEDKVALKIASKPSSMLYIKTDKTIYLTTEVIWFAGYLLPYTIKNDTLNADMLSVALLNEQGDEVIRKTYAVNNLISSGSLTLPDNMPSGNYQLIAHTNLLNSKKEPVQTFRAPLVIKSESGTALFSTKFDLQEQNNPDTIFLRVSLKDAEGMPKVNRKGIKRNGHISYGLTGKKLRTAYFDELGYAILSIPKTEIINSTGVLHTATTSEGSTKYFNLRSPLLNGPLIDLNFFPEGGDLVNELTSVVPFEAKFKGGRPAIIKAELLENGLVSDTLSTDSTGMGQFSIKPKKNHEYVLRLISQSHVEDPEKLQDKRWAQLQIPTSEKQQFKLPAALDKGIVLKLPQSVANDTLSVEIHSNLNSDIYIAMTHVLSNHIQISPLIKIGRSKKIQIPLENINKGINALTILDEQGNPHAESLFFAHYNHKNSAQIELVEEKVGLNQQISASFDLKDASNQPIGGVFSISAVRMNRLLEAKKVNMQAHYHLNFNLPQSNLTDIDTEKTSLEQALRTQGWKQLIWKQLTEAPELNIQGSGINLQVPTYTKLGLQGRVRHRDGYSKLKGPFNVMFYRDSVPTLITTDKVGGLSPDPIDLMSKESSGNLQFKTFGKDKNVTLYVVDFKDPMEKLIQPEKYPFPNQMFVLPDQDLSFTNENYLGNESFTNVNKLRTVEIKTKSSLLDSDKNKAINKYAELYGDYICQYGYINCPNHPPAGFMPPSKTPSEDFTKNNIQGIYTAREFYGMQELKKEFPNEQLFLSTLYWNPLFLAEAGGKNTISFNSSNAPGLYKISIEGLADNGDFIYAEKIITVSRQQ